ncbi:unnamed protein product [Ambrosiozyma monospora]|uniref:Unnamed protein product n=1 Tax=Ambrosiozyma monospora TaxID=43982 RepID=A0ACB5SV44_AMBMO|nr:unnamed protein product [Ambrosiozyma monospora]
MTATYDYVQPDPDTTIVEIVGTIDCGLLAASWSPDEENLAILSAERNVLLLSRLFEPIAEKFLNPNEITRSSQVSVGWGKKETQFKGKGAKQLERERLALKHAGLNIDSDNAILHDPTVAELHSGTLSQFDYQTCKISWRGDGQYFAVTSIEEIEPEVSRRVIRVYSRDGELDSCSEAVDGQEENLSWKPQGSLIASTQRRFEEEIGEEVLDLIFFERNGLRHGEFTTRLEPGSKIVDLDWSSNSEIIAFQLFNSVQIWTTKNYHWYLKKEIFTSTEEPIEFIKFHPEKPLKLMIGTSSGIEIVDMTYSITSGPTASPDDVGMTLVVDGSTCMVTPFAIANVPPPMSLREIDVDGPIVDAAVSKSNSLFAVMTNDSVSIATVDLSTIVKGGKHPEVVTSIPKGHICELGDHLRQVAVVKDNVIAVLFDTTAFSRIALIDVTDVLVPVVVHTFDVEPCKAVLMQSSLDWNYLTYETVDGSVFKLEVTNFTSSLIGKFPQLCNRFGVAVVSRGENESDEPQYIPFGVTANGRLFMKGKPLCAGVTSMLLTDSHLLYTTAQHQLKFVHLVNNTDLFDESGSENMLESAADENDERTRMVERGSLLVSAIPSKSLVVLQAPRGNLETICPRIMVLTEVRTAISERRYKDAFLTCRTHRIALDILHDYNPDLFYSHIKEFINQVGKVEYLDLFLSCLIEEDVCETKYKETLKESGDASDKPGNAKTEQEAYQQKLLQSFQGMTVSNKPVKPQGKEKISKICDAVLNVLLTPQYKQKYMQTIITAYACQHPPKTKEALELIASFTNEIETEKTVQHLCFLLDVLKLYNISLSTYNIPLTLVIAQQSQMDPKEYLPFLQNLHVQTDLRKKFLIDTHLKNFEKALDSLIQMSPEESENLDDEILSYIVDHALYKHAMKLYHNKDKEKFKAVQKAHADYLHSSQIYSEAAATYEQLGYFEDALECYIMANKWHEALMLASRPELKSQLEDTAERLVVSLSDLHDYSSAAYIQYKYLNNIGEALKLYCKDYHYGKAILLCYEEKKVELVETVVDPAIGEGFGIVAELLADCKGQINSQLKRLRELRAKKQEDPFAFYGDAGENADTPDNVSIAASETSTKESFFTRYTGKTAGTAKTGASRRTAKNRRREERKKARGKKGTIYEEEYLIKSVGRLIERLEKTESEAIRLIEALLRRNMNEQAYQIQKNYVEVMEILKENVVEIYSMNERDRERIDERGMVYLIPEIPVPTIKDFAKLNVLDY